MAAARGASARPLTDPEARAISEKLAATAPAGDADRQLLSVAEIRRQNAARNTARQAAQSGEAARMFAQGRQAEADDKLGAAKIYYRMAAKRADDPLKTQIAARLTALTAPRTASTCRTAPMDIGRDGKADRWVSWL